MKKKLLLTLNPIADNHKELHIALGWIALFVARYNAKNYTLSDDVFKDVIIALNTKVEEYGIHVDKWTEAAAIIKKKMPDTTQALLGQIELIQPEYQ